MIKNEIMNMDVPLLFDFWDLGSFGLTKETLFSLNWTLKYVYTPTNPPNFVDEVKG